MAERKKAGPAEPKQPGAGRKQPADSGADVPAPSVRKGYDAAREPEPQGDGDPGPDTASENRSG